MRIHFALVSLLSILTTQAFAGMSHKRLSGETSERAFARYAAERAAEGLSTELDADSAYGRRVDFSALDLSTVPAFASIEELTQIFKDIRDLRHLNTPARPSFSRRISWLYPDDGCFARAAMARKQIEDNWGKHVAKLFIFGNLHVETPNAPGGSVDWAWHVVPIATIEGVLYVIDPAIEPSGPITAEAWALRQVRQVEDATFAVCNSYSYGPYSRCAAAATSDEAAAASDQQSYLGYEWGRIEDLGRDPVEELGEHPPWL